MATYRLPVPPERLAGECHCLALQRAARATARRYDEALRPCGLNNGQFSMLASVAGLQPVSIQRLADHLVMDRTTVTAALKPLARRGLLEVQPAATDQRSRESTLSAEGMALLRKATALWSDAQRDAARRLGAEAAPVLARHLRRLA